MSVQFSKYLTLIRQRVKDFLEEKQVVSDTTERCCIYISSQDIYLVHCDIKEDTYYLLHYQIIPYSASDDLATLFSTLHKRYNLQSVPTTWTLSPEDYQLFLIESLPVPADEFRDALSWRIRSLISYPLEEAILDCFTIPSKKTAQDSAITAAIVAKQNLLNKTIQSLKANGLNLNTIDIPELAMRNLTALYENDAKPTAFIYFFEQVAILNITSQKTLYFTRRINISNQKELSTTEFEQISLEILRYFDYFQSQWRYPNPSRVFVAAINRDDKVIAKTLSENLMLTVEPYQFTNIVIEGDLNLSEIIDKNLTLVVGGILREAN